MFLFMLNENEWIDKIDAYGILFNENNCNKKTEEQLPDQRSGNPVLENLFNIFWHYSRFATNIFKMWKMNAYDAYTLHTHTQYTDRMLFY